MPTGTRRRVFVLRSVASIASRLVFVFVFRDLRGNCQSRHGFKLTKPTVRFHLIGVVVHDRVGVFCLILDWFVVCC